jgi:Flp pilus assembly pilin Flp
MELKKRKDLAMANFALAVRRWARRVPGSEDAQGLVEYTLILALVSIVAVVAVTDLGSTIVTKLFTLSNSL